MGRHNNYPGIDPRITRIVAREAEKVTCRLGFTESFIQDVEQDLHITVSSALSNLQEDIFEKSVQQIVKNRAIDIIRWHQRDCRTARQEAFSTNSPTQDSDDPDDDMAQIMDLESLRRNHLGLPPPWEDHRAESTDIAEVLAALPNDLRKLADALDASNGNLIEAARESGMPHKKARIMRVRLQRAIGWLRNRDI
jgi:DNA-directed RNA polymerase specialized sigma24 family protein